MRKSILFILLSSLLFFSSNNNKDEKTYLKISSLKAKPIIKGKINGQNAYFLIDTGADITLLDSKDAKKFQYRLSFPNNHKSIVGFSGRAVSLSGVKKWKC